MNSTFTISSIETGQVQSYESISDVYMLVYLFVSVLSFNSSVCVSICVSAYLPACLLAINFERLQLYNFTA